MSQPLEGQVALVTGASRGIGHEIAMELARQGADVVVAARSKDRVEPVAQEIEKLGRKSLALELDVANLEQVQESAKVIGEALGKVTVLVNNAGVTRDQLLARMKDDDWNQVLQINLNGTFYCTKVFSRDMMRARSGRIINISSVIGTIGNAGQTNYAASKAAVHGLTRSVAKELGSRGVTVNAIAPGYIQTAMTQELGEDVQASLLKSIPLGRLGEPGDIAKVVSFLASPSAAYITGQVIHVDGGMVMA